jgi:hypothetical protein
VSIGGKVNPTFLSSPLSQPSDACGKESLATLLDFFSNGGLLLPQVLKVCLTKTATNSFNMEFNVGTRIWIEHFQEVLS